jgi:hypothetical protein
VQIRPTVISLTPVGFVLGTAISYEDDYVMYEDELVYDS